MSIDLGHRPLAAVLRQELRHELNALRGNWFWFVLLGVAVAMPRQPKIARKVGDHFIAISLDGQAGFSTDRTGCREGSRGFVLEEAKVPISLGRQGVVRRWVSPLLMFAGIAIGLVAISRATDPQDSQKTQVATPTPPGEAEIRNLLKAVTDAYNRADAKELAARFTDDASLFDQDGQEVRGREAIGRHYAEAFGEGPTCKISGAVEAVHFLSPDIASVAGRFQLEGEKGAALSSGHYSLIAVRKDDQWRLAELRDIATASDEAANEGGPLRDLDWLVGDWVDESEDGKVASSVRWDEGRKFLVRKYSIQIVGEPNRSATQWIGWDPQAKQIRSWIFDSEGDFGQGQWSRSGNAWIVKASGTTGDGLTTSSTQVIEPINKDSLKVRSTDRIVGAELLPDIEEVVMVRKPPPPASDRPAPPSERKPTTGASAPKSDRP
jgi:uncharacterized protein (TIGR02246 family)